MFCHCGGCPADIPRKETVEFLCYKCLKPKEGWMDVNLVYGRCDGCKKMAFCHVKAVEQDWEKEYM